MKYGRQSTLGGVCTFSGLVHPIAVSAQVPITLKMSVLPLTPTESSDVPRQCALFSHFTTNNLPINSLGTETAATGT